MAKRARLDYTGAYDVFPPSSAPHVGRDATAAGRSTLCERGYGAPGQGDPDRPETVAANNAIIALPLNPVVPAAQRLCTARTPSGLGYTMLRPAAGTKAGQGDLVLVNYIGYRATSGVVFDQGMRSALSVDGVIQGFSQGLHLLARTGIARFCIPASIGYGAQATGPIPANADLVFQVELVDYKPAADAGGATDPQGAHPAS